MTNSIAVDAMGGDYGPSVTVPGTLSALSEARDVEFILIGDKQKISEQLAMDRTGCAAQVEVVHAPEVVEMNESPAHALRRKKQSSMRVALDLLKNGEVKACVSAGNTGALMAIALVVLRPLPGVHRPAIIGQIPTVDGHVHLLDLGANAQCTAEDLFQFGIMGSTYAACMGDKPNPVIRLLNIGVEDIKGNQVIKGAAKLFQESALNYDGYIEGDAIFSSHCDVIVCDGFSGNIAIKTSAGVSKFIQNALAAELQRNLWRKLTAVAIMPALRQVKARIDPRVFNGAGLIGLRGTVIKSHGAADSVAFFYALKQALFEIKHDIPGRINQHITLTAETTA